MPEEEGRRAGDMVGKGTSTMELLYGSLSGMAFGLVSPIAGQPFDIVKTKMQADAHPNLTLTLTLALALALTLTLALTLCRST